MEQRVDDLSHSNMRAPGRRPPYADLRRRVQELEKESRRLKRINEALEKSNEKYRAVVESQTEFICRFLPDGTLTFVNDALARRMEKHPEQLSALSLENPVVEIDQRILDPNREVTWLHWINTAVCEDSGRVAEIQGMGRDVSELKRVQESLKKSEQRFRYFLETMSEGFSQLNEDLILVYVNLKLCEMVGYEREELLGQSAMMLLGEEGRKMLL
jgi:PAS domain-containing protein